jgi:hypothetical protein
VSDCFAHYRILNIEIYKFTQTFSILCVNLYICVIYSMSDFDPEDTLQEIFEEILEEEAEAPQPEPDQEPEPPAKPVRLKKNGEPDRRSLVSRENVKKAQKAKLDKLKAQKVSGEAPAKKPRAPRKKKVAESEMEDEPRGKVSAQERAELANDIVARIAQAQRKASEARKKAPPKPKAKPKPEAEPASIPKDPKPPAPKASEHAVESLKRRILINF